MGVAFLYGNGGGGGGLNCEIKTYASSDALPASAKSNNIAVITDAVMPEWIFSANPVDEPADGAVWFETGPSSDLGFNILKKNAIYVYPVSCKQYINGEWADRFAYVYQNGEWVQFSEIVTNFYLYNLGDDFVSVTGGWVAKGTSYGEYAKSKAPTVTRNETSIHLKTESGDANDWAQGVYRTTNKIDLTGYNTLNINVLLSSGTGGRQLCIMDDSSYVATVGVVEGVNPLDISKYNTGSYYVGVCMRPNASWNRVTCEFDAIWLSK